MSTQTYSEKQQRLFYPVTRLWTETALLNVIYLCSGYYLGSGAVERFSIC